MKTRLIISMVILCLIAIFIGVIANIFLSYKPLPSSGVIASGDIGIYQESDCSTVVSNISWGTVYPGDSVSRIVYIRHEGTINITLSFNVTDWLPTNASMFLYIDWDYDNTVLIPEEVRPVVFTLYVNATVSGIKEFSNNIYIYTWEETK